MFPFIPRKVAKAAGLPSHTPAPSMPIISQKLTSEDSDGTPLASSSGSNTVPGENATHGALSGEDYAILVCLSLTDYALWVDPVLRRTVDTSHEGYIPLMHLMHHSSYLNSLYPAPPEALVAKSIRAYAADAFDIRMLVSAPPRFAWNPQDTTESAPVGSYELRLKTWQSVLSRARNSSRNEWESRTVYIENIPLRHRSTSGICRYICNLLNPASASVSPCSDSILRVQNITLPPHHQDKQGDRPKCKGFALVTICSNEDATTILTAWPWDRRSVESFPEDTPAVIRESAKFGFRTLQKDKWAALQEAYLEHRQRLLDQIALAEQADTYMETADDDAQAPPPDRREDDHTVIPPAIGLSFSDPFPRGCLVFVRNVHRETNKTTIGALLSHAFGDAPPKTGVDYIDYSKGMESCYIRLAAPQHATTLAAYFTAHPTVQSHGLDNVGEAASAGKGRAINVELIQGTPEELYWAKVPDKVCRQAVEKAIKLSASGLLDAVAPNAPGSPKARKRKRGKDAQ